MNYSKLFNRNAQEFISIITTQNTSMSLYRLLFPCGPKEECAPPYCFKNHLSLTNNSEEFVERVRAAKVSGNLDSPEGGLDAVMQAMVCKNIQWREKATRLLVYSSGKNSEASARETQVLRNEISLY